MIDRLNRWLKGWILRLRNPMDAGPAPGLDMEFRCAHRMKTVTTERLKCQECGKTEPWRGSYEFSD